MKRKLYAHPWIVLAILMISTSTHAQQKRLPVRVPISSMVLVPTDGSTVSGSSVRIIVRPVLGARKYTVELSTHPEFKSDVITKTKAGFTFEFDQLPPSSTWFARVKTNRSSFGKVTSFKTEAMSNVMVAVGDGQANSVDYSMLSVKVNAPSPADKYTVSVSTSPDFKWATSFSSLYDGHNEFLVRGLGPDKKYFIRASGEDKVFGPTMAIRTRKKAAGQLLWGITTTGGAGNQGTIFSFDPETRSFSKSLDYRHPEYDFVNLSGSLVRTPEGFAALSVADGTGGGEVFTMAPDQSIKILETYGPHNGSLMLGSDNYLYLVDDWINYFQGGIYKIHSKGDDVFPLDRIIQSFEAETHGRNPVSQLYQSGGFVYGNAPVGGVADRGTLFRVAMDGSSFNLLHTFKGADGATPSGALVEGNDGFLYGVTAAGGTRNNGVVYRIKPDGTAFRVLHFFSGTNGATPKGSLLWVNGKLFGTTSGGGSNGEGVLFRINADGSGFAILHNFSETNGGSPLGGLTRNKAMLYGMTSSGGDHGLGVIFQLNMANSQYASLFSFSSETGGRPNGNLILVEDFENSIVREAAPISVAASESNYSGLSVYPNPFRDAFTAVLDLPGEDDVQYQLSDPSGNVLLRHSGKGNLPVEMGRELHRGIYFLKITQGDKVRTERLIKQ